MCSASRHNEYEGTTLTERTTLATAPSATTEQVLPEQRAVEETLVARSSRRSMALPIRGCGS
jgi:hypothetical protein